MTRSINLEDIDRIFSQGGALEKTLPDFEMRSAQKKMAWHVSKALKEMRYLIVEAGTGIGKTFSYLIPALLFSQANSEPLLISTYTRNLQMQLFNQDLPLAKKALNINCDIALLMGRQNYICRNRLARLHLKPSLNKKILPQIYMWVADTENGSIEDWPFHNQKYLWYNLCASLDLCQYPNCPYLKDCFVIKARKHCHHAQIAIINHHLFFSNLKYPGTEEGSVLPPFKNIIFDEAHHLEEAGINFFGFDFQEKHLDSFCQDLKEVATLMGKNNIKNLQDFVENVTMLAQKSKGFFQVLRKNTDKNEQQILQEGWTNDLKGAPEDLLETLDKLLQFFKNFPSLPVEEEGMLMENKRKLQDFIASLNHFLTLDLNNYVFWAEKNKSDSALKALPLRIDNFLKETFQNYLNGAVFTSATISVDADISRFTEEMGLPPDRVDKMILPSPFEYQYQTQFIIPEELPPPGSAGYTKESIYLMEHLQSILGPRVLILFTAYKMLEDFHNVLKGSNLSKFYAILKQGEKTPDLLVNTFKKEQKAILLGTSSFWEGIDLPGHHLTTVIIMRLPFPVPDDPWIYGKAKQLEEMGRNPFSDLMLPKALLRFKQGWGRLIRSYQDRGLIMLFDTRIATRNYGKTFLRSLPDDMPVIIGKKEKLLSSGKKFWEKEGKNLDYVEDN